jgi:hypothetical protein
MTPVSPSTAVILAIAFVAIVVLTAKFAGRG